MSQGLTASGTTTGIAAAVQGWHPSTDIQTFRGLAGTYLWFEQPGSPGLIIFSFRPGLEGIYGNYQLYRGFSVVEQGFLYCLDSTNSISGQGVFSLSIDGTYGRTFVVQGMFADDDWKVRFMLLTPEGTSNPTPPSFVCIRVA